jgi:hypothetical protein
LPSLGLPSALPLVDQLVRALVLLLVLIWEASFFLQMDRLIK